MSSQGQSTGYGNRKHWKVLRRREEDAQRVQRPLQRCAESGKATGKLDLPRRRFRCGVCGRLVRMRLNWEGRVVVQLHYLPAADAAPA